MSEPSHNTIQYNTNFIYSRKSNKLTLAKSSQVKYALFRHKQIHVSRPHMGDMASEKCINSKA